MYNQKAIFHLPGLFSHFDLYLEILHNYQVNPDMFKENVVIGSIYDSPPCIWNGGRLVLGYQLKKDELENVKNAMEAYGIPVRFTFTNCLLEEQHTYDTYGNLILKIFNNGNNEIICNTEVLEHYIREKYGNDYKYISSTTKRLGKDKSKQLEELEKDYHLIVLDYDYNKNFDFLNSIQNKEQCEILCNAVCPANCPYRAHHYKQISQFQLDFDDNVPDWCQYHTQDALFVSKEQESFISPEDINDIYLPMGFNNFKLEGRTTTNAELIEILLYYLIKEEYQSEVRYYLNKTFS